jgi:ribosome assembly protein RRB1
MTAVTTLSSRTTSRTMEEEDICDNAEEDDEDGDQKMETEDADEDAPGEVYIPGRGEEPEGELEYDSSAYELFHTLNLDWPALSFDFLPDPLGHQRTKFPMTMYAAMGSQADTAGKNKLTLLKASSLHRTKNDGRSDDDDSDSDDDLADDPVLEHRSVKHHGGVNRVRCMPQEPGVVATWSDTGSVHVWDLKKHYKALDRPPAEAVKSDAPPAYTFEGHASEGFALDWSPLVAGRLASGDCRKRIHVWEKAAGSDWVVDKVPFSGHTDSVEDIQWSPTEATVFASCSVDQTVRVWDTRNAKRTSALSVKAHATDVNVISWNKLVPYLMVSGADDGTFRIWDLRKFSDDAPAAHYKWHSSAVTSVQWHPTDESVLAVAAADHQITIWDLSLERDADAEAEAQVPKEHIVDTPPQLLFIHQGMQDPKELHWHRQCPGVLGSTGSSGFQLFKTINSG